MSVARGSFAAPRAWYPKRVMPRSTAGSVYTSRTQFSDCAAPYVADVGHVLFLFTYPQRVDTLAVDAILIILEQNSMLCPWCGYCQMAILSVYCFVQRWILLSKSVKPCAQRSVTKFVVKDFIAGISNERPSPATNEQMNHQLHLCGGTGAPRRHKIILKSFLA